MHIGEPVTTLTDYLLGAVCIVLGARLVREAERDRQLSVLMWALAFVFTGIASLTGGTYHGFEESLGLASSLVLWKLTMVAIGLASLLLLAAAIRSVTPRSLAAALMLAAVAKFFLFAVQAWNSDDFRYPIIDYAISMSIVLFLRLVVVRTEAECTLWIVAGIGLSFIGASIQAIGFSLASWMNHNDIYHLIQIAAMLLLYRGGRLLRDA